MAGARAAGPDFTQVNSGINRVLVGRAMRLLDPQRDERVVDWFCGLGNVKLPLVTRAREVLGIEGSATLVECAQQFSHTAHVGSMALFERAV